MGRILQYVEKTHIYPYSSAITTDATELNVNYVIPVCPNSKYTIVMDEIGNRLRAVFTSANPLTTTSNIAGCTDIVMNPTFDVGYTFSYTPTAYGYIVVYVSNAGEHPNITISTDGAGGDDKYTVACTEVSSGTTLTGSIFARAGDFVFCTLTTRSETTLPEGWTVLAISQTTASLTQRMSLLYKQVDSDGMVSFTATQASSARIYMNLIAFSGIKGFRYSGGEFFYDADEYDSFAVERPTPKTLLWAMSANYWSSTSPFSPWTCDEISSPVITLPSTTQGRQGNFIDEDGGTMRTFIPGSTGTSGIIMWVQVIDGEYNSTGNFELSTAIIRGVSRAKSSCISWDVDTPDGTSIAMYAKLTSGEYSKCDNGGTISCIATGSDLSQETLYLRAVLSTDDTSATPVLKNIRIQLFDADDDNVIVLVFDPGNMKSIQCAAGDIIVSYDGSGSLMGQGGPVLAFDKAFTPVGLESKNHPHDAEHIELTSIQAICKFVGIQHVRAYATEHVSLRDIVAVGKLTGIDDI